MRPQQGKKVVEWVNKRLFHVLLTLLSPDDNIQIDGP
jgi:hypothetical protein